MSVQELAARYARRVESAAEQAAGGASVMGIVGRDVPAFLVAASGATPFRIPPVGDDLDEAEDYLGRATDRAALAVAAAVLAGGLDFLRGILIAHDNEGSLRLFYALRELYRRGRTRVPVHLVDQVHLQRESTLRFNTGQLLGMMATVCDWSGSSVTRASLAAAWEEQSALRAALARLRDARALDGGPDGRTALHAYALASAAPTDDDLAAIRGAVPTAGGGPRTGALPLLLTGSAPLDDGLYRAVESAGAVIVGEDHDWGDPILTDLLPATPPANREAAADAAARSRLAGAPASASASMAARAAATAAAIRRTGARGLLGVVRQHDEAPAWDWERQRAAVGVPAVLVRGPESQTVASLSTALATLGVAA